MERVFASFSLYFFIFHYHMYVIKIEQDKNTDMKMDLKVLCVQIVYSFGTIISYIIHTVSSHYVCKDMYICIIV